MKLAKLQGKPEIFHTIQGEGKSIGKPCIFIRTSLCNLHCIWCDTDYTWNWEGSPFATHTNKKYSKDQYIIELSSSELVDEVLKYDCKHLVITGGEPLMQQIELAEALALLKAGEYFIEVETNGTLTPKKEFDQYISQYNVSPKLDNSNNSLKIREKPKALAFFSQSEKSNFKFVVEQESDLQEILLLVNKYEIDAQKVYLMPEGKTPEDLNSKQQWLIDVCKKYNFNFTDRLHIHVYGAKRGV